MVAPPMMSGMMSDRQFMKFSDYPPRMKFGMRIEDTISFREVGA
jgi:hypothetical protein